MKARKPDLHMDLVTSPDFLLGLVKEPCTDENTNPVKEAYHLKTLFSLYFFPWIRYIMSL